MGEPIFFHGWEPLLRVAVVGLICYPALIVMLRLSGKRTLSRMTAYDFIISMALGSIIAKILLTGDNALAESLLAMALLIFMQCALSWASCRSKHFRRLLSGEPALLYHHGEFLSVALQHERVTREEIRAAVAERGISDMQMVESVILGGNGQFAVLLTRDCFNGAVEFHPRDAQS